jgi:hypothetical protein
MAFTRNQAKQQQKQQQQTIQSNNYLPANSNIYTLHSSPHPHSHLPNRMIDFIDASIEWRKNKIKGDNCTFEYI